MQAQFKCKRVPWSQLEEYLAVHQLGIGTYLDLLKNDLTDKESIEANIPRSFWKLHEVIVEILKANDIFPKEEEQKVDELQMIVKTVMKLQSQLISHNSKDKLDVNQVIKAMKPEIEKLFGNAYTKEISKLLKNLEGMTDIIEDNFT